MLRDLKYYDCPDCKGKGEVIVGKLYPSGHTECLEPCEFCEGEGVFEEEDFLILRLEGKV